MPRAPILACITFAVPEELYSYGHNYFLIVYVSLIHNGNHKEQLSSIPYCSMSSRV